MFDNPTCPQFPARPPHGGEPFIVPPAPCRKPGLPVLSVNGRVPDGNGDLAFAYIDGAEYVAGYGNPPRPALLFRQGSEVVAVVDATPLLKDGMVSSVAVSDGKLVITFNTDAGKEPVSVPLTEIFDPGAYYDKTAADGRFALKGEMSVAAGTGADADKITITLRPGVLATVLRTHQPLDAYFNAAEYDSANRKILFKHGSVVKAQIDATAFVKDGMVSTVAISGGNLVITFNTDAGKAPVSIPLTDIFNPANYYDKTATNTLLSGKADKVANATSGNLAALDANGNLTDSGKKPSDFQSALSDDQRANIAAVSDALTFDVTHSYAEGDPVVYDGTLYTFTAAHTGAWTGRDVSAVDIVAMLAGKLDKSGGTVRGWIDFGNNYNAGLRFGSLVIRYLQRDAIEFYNGWASYFLRLRGGEGLSAASLQDVAPDFSPSTHYALNALCTVSYDSDGTYDGRLYRCINPNGHTGAWVAADFAVATVEDVLAALRTALVGKVAANTAITGATKCKITYDSKGLVTGGTDLEASDIPSLYTTAAQGVASNAIALSDRTFNVLDATLLTGTIAVTMPTTPATNSGKVANVLLRVVTGADVPTLDFDETANVFIAADDAWAALEANSHNVFSFTASGTSTASGTTKRVWVVGRVTAAVETGGV